MKKRTGLKTVLAVVLACIMSVSTLMVPSSVLPARAKITPVDMKLGFNGISGGNWFFSQETSTTPDRFYKAEATIDGSNHDVVLEYTGGQMIIYSNFFSGTPGSNFVTPAVSFVIKKDTILTPVAVDVWSEIADGQTYRISDELALVYKGDEWGVDTKAEECMVGLGAFSWNDADKTYGITLANTEALAKTKWYQGIDVQDVYTWVSLSGKVLCDGKEETMAFDFPGNGEVFIRLNGKAKENVVIKKDTVFASADNSIKLQFDKNYTVDVPGKSVSAEKKKPVALKLGFNGISAGTWFFSQDTTVTMSGFYQVEAEINGQKHAVVMDYGAGQLMIYSHCFTATPGNGSVTPTTTFTIAKDAILQPVDSTSWSNIEDAQTYQLSEMLALECKNGTWSIAGTAEECSVGLGAFSWNDADKTYGITLSNTEALTITKWYQAIDVNDATTWVSLSGKVLCDGKEETMAFDFPGNGEVFIRLNGKAKETLIIKKDTVFSSTNGSILLTFDKNYDIDVKEKEVYEEGKRPDNTPITPVDMKLGFNGISAGTWFFSQETMTVPNGFYLVEAEIDGKKQEVVMEYGAEQMMIYSNFFSATPGTGSITPKKNFMLKKGAILQPVDSNKGWATVKRGQTYQLTKDLSLVCDADVWAIEGSIEKTYAGLDSYAWSDANTYGLKLSNIKGLKESKWYSAIKTADNLTWVSLTGTVIGDGKEHTVAIDFPGNGEVFVRINGAFKKTMVIKKNTVFSSIDGTVRFTFDKNYEIDLQDKEVYEEGKRPVYKPVTPLSIKVGFNGISAGTWFFSQKTTKVPKGFYLVEAVIDGKKQSVVIEYGAEQLMIYSNFFTATPGNNSITPKKTFKLVKGSIMEPVDSNKNWSVMKGSQTYKLSNTLSVVCDNKVWAVEGSIEKTSAGLDSYAWSDENTYGLKLSNTKGLKKSKWYSAIKTADNFTWVSLSGKVIGDGKEYNVAMDFPGNGEVFVRINGRFKNTMVIKKGSVFTSIDGTVRFTFDKNYEIDLKEKMVFEEGKRPKEKKAVHVTMTYNKVANSIFDFLGADKNGKRLKSGFYRTQAVVDGKTIDIVVEYADNSGLFYLYPHCFTGTPSTTPSTYPEKSFEIKKNAKLTPVVKDVWTKDYTEHPYIVDNSVSLVVENDIWMTEADKAEYAKYKPLEVTVSFEYVKGRSLVLKVKTANGKTIQDIYGDWKLAYGGANRGIEMKKGKYEFTKEAQTTYCLTGEYFYLDSLRLSELDAVTIPAGTIIYPDKDCKTRQPIKIVNTFCMVRDAKDKWTADTNVASVAAAMNTQTGVSSPQTGETTVFPYQWIAVVSLGICMIILMKKREVRRSGNLEK